MKYSNAFFGLLMLLQVLVGGGLKPGSTDNFDLAKHKAGHVEIGMTIDSLYTKYERRSTRLTDLRLEGTFSPALEIRLKGRGNGRKPSLIAEIGCQEGWVVSRVSVYDRRFKTDEGIGVGSTLGDLRKFYTVDWIAPGEIGVFARVEELAMSFALDKTKIPQEWYQTEDQTLIPDSVEVVSILIN